MAHRELGRTVGAGRYGQQVPVVIAVHHAAEERHDGVLAEAGRAAVGLAHAYVVEPEVVLGEAVVDIVLVLRVVEESLLSDEGVDAVPADLLAVVQRVGQLPRVFLGVVPVTVGVDSAGLGVGLVGFGRTRGSVVPVVLPYGIPGVASGGPPGEVLEEVELYAGVHLELPVVPVVVDRVVLKYGVVEVILALDFLEFVGEILMDQLVVAEAHSSGGRLEQGLSQGGAHSSAAFGRRTVEGRAEIQPHALPEFMVDLGPDGVARVAVLGHDTVLVIVVVAQQESGLVIASGDADIVRLGERRVSEHEILPVYGLPARIFVVYAGICAGVEIGVRERAAEHVGPFGDLAARIEHRELILVLHIVLDSEHGQLLAQALELAVDIVGHRSLAGLAGLGGDQDHSVGALRTVDRGRGRILEHVDALDVIDIHHAQRVLHREAVDYIERRSRLGDGVAATDVHIDLRTRRTALGHDADSGRLARKSLGGGGDGNLGELVSGNGYRRTRQILSLDLGIADRHGLLKIHGGLMKDDIDDIPSGDVLYDIIIAEQRICQCPDIRRDRNGILTVLIGHFSDGRAAGLSHDDRSVDRIAAGVRHLTGDCSVLSPGHPPPQSSRSAVSGRVRRKAEIDFIE